MGLFKGIVITFVLVLSKDTCFCQEVNINNSSNGLDSDKGYTLTSSCSLRLVDESIRDKLYSLKDSNAKLIGFVLKIVGYNASADPLSPPVLPGSGSYEPARWVHVYHAHGRALLALGFNYDVLSLSMLTHGVHDGVQVELSESTAGCFAQLDEDDKMSLLQQLIISDFQTQSDVTPLPRGEYVCNQVVERGGSSHGAFSWHCCSAPSRCEDSASTNVYIASIFSLIALIKIAFLLFGPLLFQKLLSSDPVRTTCYQVQLNRTEEIKVNKVKDETCSPDHCPRGPYHFHELRGLLADKPHDQVVSVKYNTIHLSVDHKKLMSEKSVPVGLLRFLWTEVLLCRLRRHRPLNGCWDSRLLSGTKWKVGKSLTWGRLISFIGKLLMLILIPLPYYIRVILYQHYEAPEISRRMEAIRILGVQPPLDHNLFQYISPTHGAMVVVYITYVAAFIILGLLQSLNKDRIEDLVLPPIKDMARVPKGECLQLLLSHLVLPFQRYGLFVGFLVGLVYWTIMIPVCIVVVLVYCIPTLYLCGRYFIRTPPAKHRRAQYSKLGSDTPQFFRLNLDDINKQPEDDWLQKRPKAAAACDVAVGGVVCVLMVAILLMYAESFGVLVEVAVCTLMGVIINAGVAVDLVMLAFWIVTYVATCYNNVYDDYMALSQQIFGKIKENLKGKVKDVVRCGAGDQKDTAFLYNFGPEAPVMEQSFTDDVVNILDADPDVTYESNVKCSKLFWNIYHLVFFLSRDDIPRIPKKLFRRLCEIEAPGCPGPEYRSLLRATQQLTYMIVFIAFVFLVVRGFDARVSSTNQFLLTMAGGFIPFVIRFVLKPKAAAIYLNTYTFEGKFHNVLEEFHQEWLVTDLSMSGDSSKASQQASHTHSGTSDGRRETDANAEDIAHMALIAGGTAAAAAQGVTQSEPSSDVEETVEESIIVPESSAVVSSARPSQSVTTTDHSESPNFHRSPREKESSFMVSAPGNNKAESSPRSCVEQKRAIIEKQSNSQLLRGEDLTDDPESQGSFEMSFDNGSAHISRRVHQPMEGRSVNGRPVLMYSAGAKVKKVKDEDTKPGPVLRDIEGQTCWF